MLNKLSVLLKKNLYYYFINNWKEIRFIFLFNSALFIFEILQNFAEFIFEINEGKIIKDPRSYQDYAKLLLLFSLTVLNLYRYLYNKNSELKLINLIYWYLINFS